MPNVVRLPEIIFPCFGFSLLLEAHMSMAIHDEVLSCNNPEILPPDQPQASPGRLVCGAAGLFLALRSRAPATPGPGCTVRILASMLHTLLFLKTGHLQQSVPVILRQHS